MAALAGCQVVHVFVQDNQHVNRGDLLAEIDPRDYDVRAAEARGRLADVTARISGAGRTSRLRRR